MVGKLHEIAAYSRPFTELLWGVAIVVPDFIEAQIPLTVVVRAIRRMRSLSIDKRDVWEIAIRMVQLMYQFLKPFTVQRVHLQQRA